jgi:HEAT repeat protein
MSGSVDDKVCYQIPCKDTIIAPPLIKALLEDESPCVRAEAAKALGTYQSASAIVPLIDALKDKDPWVRLNAAFSLGELKAQKAVKPLIKLLGDNSDWRNKYIQQEVIVALRKIGVLDIELFRSLMRISGDEYLKAEIVDTFARLPYRDYPDAKEVILNASKNPNDRIRKLAVKAVAQFSPTYNDIKNGSSQRYELS